MAWPPPIPPNNRANTTPQLDAHADDHNLIADALAELVNKWTAFVQVTDAPTPAAGWSVTSANLWHNGVIGFVDVRFSPTGTINVTATGDIGNQTVMTLPAAWPVGTLSSNPQALTSHVAGRIISGALYPTTRNIQVHAVAPGADIAASETLSLGGVVILA